MSNLREWMSDEEVGHLPATGIVWRPGFEYGVKASGIIASPSGNATRAFGHSSRLDLDDWSLLRDPVLARY